MPGVRIIGEAFWFVAANLFTLFRLMWLPLAVLLGAQVAIGQAMGPSPDETTALYALALSGVLQVIALSVAAVRVHRLVLFEDRRAGQYFSFPFGVLEVRYVVMIVVLVAIFIAFAVGVTTLAAYLEAHGLMPPEPRPMAQPGDPSFDEQLPARLLRTLFGFLFLPLSLGFIWLLSRLALWPAVVVATGRFGLIEALRLTRGLGLSLYFLFLGAGQIIGFAIFVRAFAADPKQVFVFLEQMRRSPSILTGWNDPIGATVFPGVQSYAVHVTPEAVALDFALTFLVIAYIAAMTSVAYQSLTIEDSSLTFKPYSA